MSLNREPEELKLSDGIYFKTEDGTILEMKGTGGIKLKSEIENEEPLFPVNAFYEFSMDIDYPYCFKDLQRYLNYHLLGYDHHNIPFFRKYFKFND